MNELQIFNSKEFGDIRTVTINNEPWFVGKDVAEALGYSNASKAVSTHVGEEDRILKVLEADSQNGNVVKTQTALINESGLYALIFGSKLESAKRFKHWVTSEVLPAIRKTGAYQKPMVRISLAVRNTGFPSFSSIFFLSGWLFGLAYILRSYSCCFFS